MGDVGRSPRMLRHAQAAKDRQFRAVLVGYQGTPVPTDVETRTFLPATASPHLPKTMATALKFLATVFSLAKVFWKMPKACTVLLQAPPAFPAALICWLYTRLMRATFVVDWHNYGDTILAMELGNDHMMVKIARAGDGIVAALADGNLCVSKALKLDLQRRFGKPATVLYDRPYVYYEAPEGKERKELLERCLGADSYQALTHRQAALAVTSTSWTVDEDFDLLLDALKLYDEAAHEALRATKPRSRRSSRLRTGLHARKAVHRESDVSGKGDPSVPSFGGSHDTVPAQGCFDELPDIWLVVTGKGPRQKEYEEKVKALDLKHVVIQMVWVQAEDFPLLLATMDLGISMHSSSSGLDLPMKVVDMFAAGIPVLAYQYECIEKELVHANQNGCLFKNAEELSHQLQRLLCYHPQKTAFYWTLKEGAMAEFERKSWEQEWMFNAMPMLLGLKCADRVDT
uniref:Beta-1,4-mannosyltransferase n=1 Tax=Picocystis salinarum TaxID=88271 RepID=A0A7S3XCS7_9CHLO